MWRGRSLSDVGDPLEIRDLTLADVPRLREIDRSEHQHVRYRVADGQLLSSPFDFQVPAWDPVGNGDHSVAGMVEFAHPIVARGADFLGAFEGNELAGIVIVDLAFWPDTAWLALLHVDRSHRRRGVASILWSVAADRARAIGKRAIYVSATPSDSAVGFYLSRGCRLASSAEVSDDLYDLEPEDIHLICELPPNTAPP
jgi:GNAT superfamily N-acetyltransferase